MLLASSLGGVLWSSGCDVQFLVVGRQVADAAADAGAADADLSDAASDGGASDAGAGDAEVVPADADVDAGPCRLCLDPGFASQAPLVIDGRGAASTDFSPQAIAVQADDRILVGGTLSTDAGLQWFVVRLTEAGAYDPGFGTGGQATIDVGSQPSPVVESLAVEQTSGSILVAGARGPDDAIVGLVARLSPTGSLDTSFGTQGLTIIDRAPGDDVVNGMVVLADGRIRLGGHCWPASTSTSNSDLCLWGLTRAGATDPTFQGGSHRAVDLGGADEFNGSLVAASGGALLVPAVSWVGTQFEAALLKVDEAGHNAGFGQVSFALSGESDCTSIVEQADGHILGAGSAKPGGSETDFAAFRLLANGTLDPSFASAGKLVVDLGGQDSAAAVVVLGDGRIVLGGTATQAGHGDTDLALLTVLPDGSPDPTVGRAGRLYFDVSSGQNDRLHALVVDPHGRLVVFGSTAHGSGNDIVVLRLIP
ncbi:MAG: hypothetical protein QM765_28750 [Myxococcales bacterium]